MFTFSLLYWTMIQSLWIPNLKQEVQGKDISFIAQIMDKQTRHPLSNTPWKAYPYKPQVDFSIAHSEDSIYLKYYVTEKHIRAVNTRTNDPVYEDSCVEFFVSFDDSGYYNFECNSLGTFLLYFGTDLEHRNPLPDSVIERIKTYTTIQKNASDKTYSWTITWIIPKSIFIYHPQLSLSKQTYSANFYKCGDKTEEPHFLTWSPIRTETPAFHRPEFFGKISFE